MRRVPERLPLLNFLVKQGQGTSSRALVVVVRWLLLIKRRHAKLLMDESLMLTAAWSISVMCVVAEGRLVQVAELGHHGVDAAKETLIFFDDIELIGATSKSRDSFAQILWQYLERPIGLLAADEYFTN